MTEGTPDTPYVVFGDDQSAAADVAWSWLNSQRWPGWTLVDVQADPPAFGEHVPHDDAVAHPIDGEPPRSATAYAAFAAVEFLVARSDPRVALSEWPDAGAIVLGEASSGVGPRVVGSTTEWLLHDPPSPVVIARRGRTVRSALVCADGSDHALAAAGAFAAFPWVGEVAVEVVSVDDGRTDPAAAIEALDPALGDAVASITRTTRTGRKPHREILELAEATDPDLVVLGTHGLTTLRRLTLGSTANAVAQLVGSSVMVSRSGRS